MLSKWLVLLCLAMPYGSIRSDLRHEQYGSRLTLPNQGNRTSPTYIWIELAFDVDKSSDPSDCFLQGSWDKIEREGIEHQIADDRHAITSSLVRVLQRFLSIQARHMKTPNPLSGNFGVHFTALCNLLRAFGEVAGKSQEWAEELIAAWDRILRRQSESEEETSELEFPIQQILKGQFVQADVQSRDVNHRGREGTLYVTSCAFLLSELQKQLALQNSLPRNPSGLSRRLSSEKFVDFKVVRSGEMPEVERTSSRRKIGFFFPRDAVTANDGQTEKAVIVVNR